MKIFERKMDNKVKAYLAMIFKSTFDLFDTWKLKNFKP